MRHHLVRKTRKRLSRRTETFTDSFIRRMTRVCLKCGAVNLSQGFPDFDPPRELADVYARNRDLFLFGLDRLGIAHTVPQGAYYVMLGIGEYGYASDHQFCVDLAEKVGVGAVPGSSFFRLPVNNLIRLHFAKCEATLLEALNRLESMHAKM